MSVWVMVGADCGGDVTVRVLGHEPTQGERLQFGNEGWSRCRQLTLVGPLEVDGPSVDVRGDDGFHAEPSPTLPEGTE